MASASQILEIGVGADQGLPLFDSVSDTRSKATLHRSYVLADASPGLGAQPAISVGLVIPLHGSAGMFGLSCLACAVLAAEEINEHGGLLGRDVHLVPIDGAGPPDEVGRAVHSLVRAGAINVVVGWHLSHVRRGIARHLEAEVPYVYGTLYEGGEQAPGILLAGETPDLQILPTMKWLAEELGIRRWAVVGDDYLWPRGSMRYVRSATRPLDMDITEEMFVPLGCEDYAPVLDRLARGSAQAVLMLLVGQDAVHFNRAFAARGLDARMVRLSPLMDENMLLASGIDASRNLYSAAAYFESLATPDALDLVGRYTARFGPEAPVLNSMGESCYEALRLLAVVAGKAGSLRVPDLLAAAQSPLGYQGPRGAVYLRDRHLVQHVYLARASGVGFDVVTRV